MNLNDFSPFSFARKGRVAVKDLSEALDHLVAGRLWVKIVLALALGILVGFIMSPGLDWVTVHWSKIIVAWLSFPGKVFLGLIQLVIIPLVFASVILGIVSSDSLDQLKTLGIKIGIYYVFTTIVSVGIGFLVAYVIRPGRFINPKFLEVSIADTVTPREVAKNQDLTSVVSELIPSNPFSVLVSGEMLQVVLLAIFIGVALMSLKDEDARPLVGLLNSFQKISMIVIGWAMKLAPLAVFGLTAGLLVKIGFDALLGVGVYLITVVLGLSLVLLFYLLLVKFVVKMNPFEFLRKIRDVQLLAFSTSSSASVMPLTIETAENKLSIKPSVSQFIIPLGTTINMDGTALYQGVATIFLAQVFNIDLSAGQLLLVVLTATLSSIGAPGAPGVGMGILSVILGNVGIPAGGIVLILGVDRILDMCRTVINVTGDLTAALIMDRWK
jgi:Na+/H+-dicarboxylate symporter